MRYKTKHYVTIDEQDARRLRRRNLVPEAGLAMAPALAWSGAELWRKRLKVPRRRPLVTQVPSYTTIDKWNPEIGGSKVGHIRVDYDTLVAAFGKPVRTPEGVNGEWWPEVNWYLEFADGSRGMIYDWQVAGPIQKNRYWHVAGAPEVLDYVVAILQIPPKQVEDTRILFE